MTNDTFAIPPERELRMTFRAFSNCGELIGRFSEPPGILDHGFGYWQCLNFPLNVESTFQVLPDHFGVGPIFFQLVQSIFKFIV